MVFDRNKTKKEEKIVQQYIFESSQYFEERKNKRKEKEK